MIDFTSFIEANQGAAIVCNSTGQIIRMNKPAEGLLEYGADQVVDKDLTRLMPALKPFFDHPEGSKRPGTDKPIVCNYLLQSGEKISIEIIPNELNFGDRSYFWFNLRKVSVKLSQIQEGNPIQVNDQLELEKIKERYELAVEAGHNGIWDYSFKEKKLYVDSSLKSLSGKNW